GAPSRHLPYSAGPRFRCRILEPRSFGFSSDGPRREATPQSLLDRATRPPSASSWQGTVVSPGGAPAPPGCGGYVSSPARGRRTLLHLRNVSRRRPQRAKQGEERMDEDCGENME